MYNKYFLKYFLKYFWVIRVCVFLSVIVMPAEAVEYEDYLKDEWRLIRDATFPVDSFFTIYGDLKGASIPVLPYLEDLEGRLNQHLDQKERSTLSRLYVKFKRVWAGLFSKSHVKRKPDPTITSFSGFSIEIGYDTEPVDDIEQVDCKEPLDSLIKYFSPPSYHRPRTIKFTVSAVSDLAAQNVSVTETLIDDAGRKHVTNNIKVCAEVRGHDSSSIAVLLTLRIDNYTTQNHSLTAVCEIREQPEEFVKRVMRYSLQGKPSTEMYLARVFGQFAQGLVTAGVVHIDESKFILMTFALSNEEQHKLVRYKEKIGKGNNDSATTLSIMMQWIYIPPEGALGTGLIDAPNDDGSATQVITTQIRLSSGAVIVQTSSCGCWCGRLCCLAIPRLGSPP
eukprot:GHVS01104315.1.p1 GENE.GHVS01104315.1~~GHVS01104315.1.p1  ORF type:complete len:394 (+),score=16.01 GHVS01104315.1:135-1316(+)